MKKIRRLVSVILSMLLAAGLLSSAVLADEPDGVYTVNVSGTIHESEAWDVLDLVNQERAAAGLETLAMTAAQKRMAEQRAAELTVSFSHTRPDDNKWSTVLDAYNVTSFSSGENIAEGQADADSVMDSWMHSDGHRANILSADYTHIGIGCFENNGVKYWVQIFTKDPSDTEAAAEATEETREYQTTVRVKCTHPDTSLKSDILLSTCEEQGVEKIICSDCGLVISETALPLADHTPGEWQTVTEAGWDTAGLKVLKCSICDVTLQEEEIPALSVGHEHDFTGAGEIIKEASCTEKGILLVECSSEYCTATREFETEALGHVENTTVVQPATCTEAGSQVTVCERCQEELSREEIPATGHQWSEWKTTKAATWDTQGEESRSCANCQEKETRPIAALSENHTEHVFDEEGIVTKTPTCTEAGEKTYKCLTEGCEEVKKETIPATGHSWSEWKTTKAATWDAEGLRTRSCDKCGAKEEEKLSKLSGDHKHDFSGDEKVTRKATCTTEGVKTIACSDERCSEVKTVKLPALGHNAGKWEVTREATCTRIGRSVQKCKHCGAVVAEKALSMKEHNYGKWEVVKEATTERKGEKQRICKDCGHKEIETIKKLTAEKKEKETKKSTAATDTKKNNNNVKTGDSMRPLFYVIMLAAAGAVISLILYGYFRRRGK